jgi:hypothetical protein
VAAVAAVVAVEFLAEAAIGVAEDRFHRRGDDPGVEEKLVHFIRGLEGWGQFDPIAGHFGDGRELRGGEAAIAFLSL